MTGTEVWKLAIAFAVGQIIANSVETLTMIHLRKRDLERRKQFMDEMSRSMAAEAMIELSKMKREEDA